MEASPAQADLAEGANPASRDELSRRILTLHDLTAPQLRAEWRRLYRAQPPRLSRDLVIRTDEELLEVRNFGETTLKEVKQKLQERGLHLGMKLPTSLRR